MRVSMMVCETTRTNNEMTKKSAAVRGSDSETKEQERTMTERGKVTEGMRIK